MNIRNLMNYDFEVLEGFNYFSLSQMVEDFVKINCKSSDSLWFLISLKFRKTS